MGISIPVQIGAFGFAARETHSQWVWLDRVIYSSPVRLHELGRILVAKG